MGSHSVTCHPTQVNTARLNPSQRPVLDLPTPEGWKAELTWVTGNIPRWFTRPQTATHQSTINLVGYIGEEFPDDVIRTGESRWECLSSPRPDNDVIYSGSYCMPDWRTTASPTSEIGQFFSVPLQLLFFVCLMYQSRARVTGHRCSFPWLVTTLCLRKKRHWFFAQSANSIT